MLFRPCGCCCTGAAGADFLQGSMVRPVTETRRFSSSWRVHHEPSNQDCHGSLRNTAHGSAVSSKLSSVSLCFWCLTIVELAESSMSCLMSLRSFFFFMGRTVRAGYRRYCPSRICGIHQYRILSYPIPFPQVLVHSCLPHLTSAPGVLKECRPIERNTPSILICHSPL